MGLHSQVGQFRRKVERKWRFSLFGSQKDGRLKVENLAVVLQRGWQRHVVDDDGEVETVRQRDLTRYVDDPLLRRLLLRRMLLLLVGGILTSGLAVFRASGVFSDPADTPMFVAFLK